jgi:osmotically-inducible protein OsmY
MTNDELIAHVSEELAFEPKVDASQIAVGANDGNVTLRGTVGSLRAKREAAKAAQRVYGVTSVDNELEVRPLLDHGHKDDADLRADVLRALMLDSMVPSTVDAKVDSGYVTLTGWALWNYQRDEAELVASNVNGVLDIYDEIELNGETPDAGEVKHSITSAIKRNAKLDAEGITVETADHTVTLKGNVASWAEHDDAVAAAWAAPGVHKVRDHLFVGY